MKRLVSFLVLIICMIFSLTACDSPGKPSAPNTTLPTPTQTIFTVIPTSIPPVAVVKVYPDRPLVYERFTKEGSYGVSGYTEGNYNQEYSYHIPEINIDSKDAATTNASIYSYCMNILSKDLSRIDKKSILRTSDLKYKVYENNVLGNGVISILIINDYEPTPAKNYKVFNIDDMTGKEISKYELLGLKHVSQDNFMNAAKDVMLKCFQAEGLLNGKTHSGANPSDDPFYQEQYNKTFSEANVSFDRLQIYIGEGARLNIIVNIYVFSGPTSLYFVLDTGI